MTYSDSVTIYFIEDNESQLSIRRVITVYIDEMISCGH